MNDTLNTGLKISKTPDCRKKEMKMDQIIYTVKAESISHSFTGHQVLDKVSFQVQKGEIFGLLGPSGAGKTTLIKILTGQLSPDSGTAELFGRDTRKLSAKERRQIGVMMDNLGLYDRLSIYNNLAFYADILHVSRHRINDILKELGLYEARNRAVSKLSKGMANRLSLARALMNDAQILFLDEPTAGLDPVTTREIHHTLRQQKEQGCTIFLTTHNMYEAQNLCSQVALLDGGKIIDMGSPTNICQKYNHLNRLNITLKDGRHITLENDSSSAPAVKEYLEKNMITSIHSTEPTLETVFIELTGKGLNEYE
jgi:ABC-2 type transport system ATP-binding protein